MHRAVERRRVTLLKVGAAAASYEERVSGEGQGLAVGLDHEGQAAVGVPGGATNLECVATKAQHIPMLEVVVHAGHLGHGRHAAERPGLLAQLARAGDVVGVHVGVEGVDELETQLGDELQVSVDALDHRVDDDGLAAARIGEQVGVGPGVLVEELLEKHGFLQWLGRSRRCQ